MKSMLVSGSLYNLPLLSTFSVCIVCFEFIMAVQFCYHQNYPEMHCDYFTRSYLIWSIEANYFLKGLFASIKDHLCLTKGRWDTLEGPIVVKSP